MTALAAAPESFDRTPGAPGRALHFGRYVLGAAAILLGVIGLCWGDFAVNWQRVSETVPHHGALAYLAAAIELLAGLAVFWRFTARLGAAVLTIMFTIFVLLWVPPILAAPRVYDSWGNFFEELSAALGGATLVAALAPAGSSWASRSGVLARIYGICPISFGLVHFIYLSGAATWVPKWLPPGQVFWTAATGVFFFLAAAALLTGLLAGLAARLLAAMIIGFGILIWIPKLLAAPHEHFVWSGNGINLALAGAAWIVADALCDRRRRILPSQEDETHPLNGG